MNATTSWILSRKYTDDSIAGTTGVLAGKNAVVDSIVKTGNINTVTFKWTANDGTVRTQSMQVSDGETPSMTVTPITNGNRIKFETSTDSITFDVEDGISPECVVSEITGGHRVKFTTKSGDTTFDVLDGVDGVSVDTVTVDSNNHLILTFSDSTTHDAGEITTLKGDDGKSAYEVAVDQGYVGTVDEWLASLVGFSPTITVEESTDNIYKLRITDVNGSYVTPNLKGSGGAGGAISELSDVELTNLQNAQVLKYDATEQVWKNANSGAVIDELGDIADVDLQNLVNGDVLTWDNYNSKWKNTAIDNEPTQYSTNMINSGAVYSSEHAIDSKIGDLTQLYTTDKSSVVGAVNEVKGDIDSNIGDLSQLTTTDKSSVVNAINEVDANADNIDSKIGALTDLTTTDKTSIVLAINEVDGGLKSLRYVEQLSVMPLADTKQNKIIQFVGTDTADYKKGYFYYSEPSVVSGEVVYNWVQTNIQPTNNDYENLDNKPLIGGVELVGDKSLDDLGINGKFQYITMPTADNSNVGRIVEFVGTSTAELTNGFFYKCVYDSEEAVYKWVIADVSGNTALANRVTILETNQGDMSALTIAGVSDLVSAINVLAVRGIKSITYAEPYLTITLMDDSTFQFDITVILNATDLGDLGNVIDTTIANTNVLQYDSSILKYKPYDVVGAMSTLLQDAKDYTDTEIGKINLDDAFLCDSKPSCSYDSGSNQWIVVYYQASQVHTSTDISARYYYKDANDDPYCTSWFLVENGGTTTAVELTYLLSSVNLDDYINRNTDVVSTYSPDMADKTKIPDIASIDVLYGLVATALGLKVNTADIVDALNSDDATVPLSAKQGKVLNLKFNDKQDVIQYSVLPVASEALYNANAIYQYTGSDSGAFKNGRFYKVVSDGEVTPTYSWQEVKFSADYDATIIEHSTNAPQGGAVYDALALKQNETLSSPVVVEGNQGTTVEAVLGLLNTYKSPVFFYSTMPQSPTVGMIVLYTGTTTQNFTQGCFYRYEEVPSTDPQEYIWNNLTPKVTTDSTMSISSTNPIENQAITGGLQALQNGVIIVYPDEASLLDFVNYANGAIVSVGTLGYCVEERSWHRVSAINSSTLAVTWVSYDPHLAGEVTGGDGIEIDAQDNNSINVKVDDTTVFINQTSNEVYGLGHNADDFDIDTTNKIVSLDVTQRAFTGTTAEWNALTDAQKAKYLIVNLIDDAGQGITVVNVVQNNNMNVPTSNAVFNFAVPKTLTTGIALGGTTYTDTVQLLTAMASLLNNTAYWHEEQQP